MKKKIVITILIVFIVLYSGAFWYARKQAKEPIIKYYDGSESITYDGIEYTLSAEALSEDKLVEKYGIETENLASYVYNTPDVEYEYFIIKRKRKRIGESVNKYATNSLVNRYALAGGWPYVEDELNNDEMTLKTDLEIGQESEDYMVYISNLDNLYDGIDIEKETFYLEFPDYEGHEYLTWVRVLN